MQAWTIVTAAKAKAGDEAALNELLKGLLHSAYRIARREQRRSRLSDRDHTFAEDAALHALFTLSQKLPCITIPESGLLAWLTIVIRNYFIDRTRWKKSQAELLTGETWPFETTPHWDTDPLEQEDPRPEFPLDAALAKLTPQELDLLTMKFVGKMTDGELAGILGISRGAVKQRVIRVLRKARRLAEEAGYDAVT